MGHDAGKFGFFLGAEDQAAIDVEEAAGESESVHFIGVDHFNSEGYFCVGIANKVLTDAIDVFGDDGVVNHFGGAFDFLGERLAEGDFAFEGIEIDALAEIAIANVVDVFLGILGVDGVLLGNRLIRGAWGFAAAGRLGWSSVCGGAGCAGAGDCGCV